MPAPNEQMRRAARQNAGEFREAGLVAVHVVGARASGKTEWLEATARALTSGTPIGVAAADLAETDRVRLSAAGAAVVSVTGGAGGVLDPERIHEAASALPWWDLEYLFVEDEADTASAQPIDLGQALTVIVISATDDPETPLANPGLFRDADLVLLTKTDLRPDRVQIVRDNLARVMTRPAMLAVSAAAGEGIDDWLRWLRGYGQRRLAPCALGVVRM